MIINTQLFNFRLIIGTLVIAIVILASFSYVNYNTLKEKQLFIEQEKNLVENELSEMISSYEAVDTKNESIAKQLEEAKSKMSTILDSVMLLKLNEPILSNYKAQINALKLENAQLIALANTLDSENTTLKEQSNTANSKETKPIAPVFKIKKEKLKQSNLNIKTEVNKPN